MLSPGQSNPKRNINSRNKKETERLSIDKQTPQRSQKPSTPDYEGDDVPEVVKKYNLTTDLPHKKFRQTVASILPTKIHNKPPPESDIVWRTPHMAHETHKRKTMILSNSTSKFDEAATTLPVTDEKNFLLGSRDKAFITATNIAEHEEENRNDRDGSPEAEREDHYYMIDYHHMTRQSSKKMEKKKTGYDFTKKHPALTKKKAQDEYFQHQVKQSLDLEPDSPRNTMKMIGQDNYREPRRRNLEPKKSKKPYLFEGINYVPYDIFLRQDPMMQHVMFRDLLKILLDKCKTFQNYIQDSAKMSFIFRALEEDYKEVLNASIEETLVLLNEIAKLIMQEFHDSVDAIGFKPSPFVTNPDCMTKTFPDETAAFFENCSLYVDVLEHLRFCVDCYFVLCREKDRKPIPDDYCFDLLQYIARARYNLGELVEDFSVLEKNIEAKIKWKTYIANIDLSKVRQTQSIEKKNVRAQNVREHGLDPDMVSNEDLNSMLYSQLSKEKNQNLDMYKKANELLKKKYGLGKNKHLSTRESKVMLNQEAEDEKLLIILQKHKQIKKRAEMNGRENEDRTEKQKKNAEPPADHRKEIILERLLNPISDPQIKTAFRIARDVTHLPIEREYLEFISNKDNSKVVKDTTHQDYVLKQNLNQILSSPKLRMIHFGVNEEKKKKGKLYSSEKNEQKQMIDTLSKKLISSPDHKEIGKVVDEVVKSMTSTRHFGCLLHNETIENDSSKPFLSKVKLPSLKKKAIKQTL